MKVRVFVFCFLISAAAVAASAITVTDTLVSPVSPPAPAPCQLATVGAHLDIGYGTQFGWANFTCTPGYTGDLKVTVSLIPYYTGSSTIVSVVPTAQASQSWPKSYRNPKCTFSSLVVSCPLGEPAYLKEYAPSSGTVSVEAWVPSGGCFKTRTSLQWYDPARFTKGVQTAETGWTGNCY